MKSNMKAIVILNIITAVLYFVTGSMYLMILSIINALVFNSLSNKNEDEVLLQKNTVLGLSILNFFSFKIATGAVGMILYSHMKKLFYQNWDSKHNETVNCVKNVVPPKPKVDPQIKKIDILLKLGVTLVFIAGFVFATTGWNSLNVFVKTLIFLIVSGLFFGLSKFSKEKIKIKSTEYLYWFLAMSFIVLMIINAGYNQMFGNYFSLTGDGYLLYFAFVSLVVSILGWITYLNFSNYKFLHVVYLGITFLITFISSHFNMSLEGIIALLISMITITKLFKLDREKEINTLSIFTNILLVVLFFIFVLTQDVYSNILLVLLSSALIIFNIYNYVYNERDSFVNDVALLVAYFAAFPSLTLLIDGNSTGWILSTSVFGALFYFISILIDSDRLKKSSLIISSILVAVSFDIATDGPMWLPLVVSIFSVIIYILSAFVDDGDSKFERILQPVNISFVLMGLLCLLRPLFGMAMVTEYWVVLTLSFYVLIYCLSQKQKMINTYEFFSLLAIVISLLMMNGMTNIINILVTFVVVIVFYLELLAKNNPKKGINIFVFILLLCNIFIGTHSIFGNIINTFKLNINNGLLSNIISIIAFISIGVLYKKDKLKSNITMFAIIVPIISLGAIAEIEWLSMILPSVFIYYSTYMICRLINSITSKKAISGIGYSLAFLAVIFNSNPYVLGYSCILFLISLFIGYIDKKYNVLFKVSVVALIAFVIYQLHEFWTLIPAWLYLLILGIALIGFATYKQLKIMDKEEKKEKEDQK